MAGRQNSTVTLNINAHGPATADQTDHAAKEVAKYCPLSNLFRQAGNEIVEDWQNAWSFQ